MARPSSALRVGGRGVMDRRRPESPDRAIADVHRGEDTLTKFRSLSVFFPAYNDAPSLPGLVRKTFETLEQHVEDYEVIVVNDGSRDNTAEVLDELRCAHA